MGVWRAPSWGQNIRSQTVGLDSNSNLGREEQEQELGPHNCFGSATINKTVTADVLQDEVETAALTQALVSVPMPMTSMPPPVLFTPHMIESVNRTNGNWNAPVALEVTVERGVGVNLGKLTTEQGWSD